MKNNTLDALMGVASLGSVIPNNTPTYATTINIDKDIRTTLNDSSLLDINAAVISRNFDFKLPGTLVYDGLDAIHNKKIIAREIESYGSEVLKNIDKTVEKFFDGELSKNILLDTFCKEIIQKEAMKNYQKIKSLDFNDGKTQELFSNLQKTYEENKNNSNEVVFKTIDKKLKTNVDEIKREQLKKQEEIQRQKEIQKQKEEEHKKELERLRLEKERIERERIEAQKRNEEIKEIDSQIQYLKKLIAKGEEIISIYEEQIERVRVLNIVSTSLTAAAWALFAAYSAMAWFTFGATLVSATAAAFQAGLMTYSAKQAWDTYHSLENDLQGLKNTFRSTEMLEIKNLLNNYPANELWNLIHNAVKSKEFRGGNVIKDILLLVLMNRPIALLTTPLIFGVVIQKLIKRVFKVPVEVTSKIFTKWSSKAAMEGIKTIFVENFGKSNNFLIKSISKLSEKLAGKVANITVSGTLTGIGVALTFADVVASATQLGFAGNFASRLNKVLYEK
ncbi:hypothetical protein GE118_02405 [Mycoplasma sp. NEAQ87857]|uniref:hypothetical protein n=1 Tax=Mycoplasma sp. NEAQ87857 TaxID=2683967 RepID=UPI001315E81F|nr:hypothetical protein [Mycoplasma sp. NEAQ87857]QGZ97646.1 hypothetical protein GE118_02405 [Mycoplasma sp. NEAQ87857]